MTRLFVAFAVVALVSGVTMVRSVLDAFCRRTGRVWFWYLDGGNWPRLWIGRSAAIAHPQPAIDWRDYDTLTGANL